MNLTIQKIQGNRLEWFTNIDKPALKPLPSVAFEYDEWMIGIRVAKDYHINILNHFYSVPYPFVDSLVDVRLTKNAVEILLGNSRIASHLRALPDGQTTTLSEHLKNELSSKHSIA